MVQILKEIAPDTSDLELIAYLDRFQDSINKALDEFEDRLEIVYALPVRPVNGMMRYFGITIPPDITALGFWGYEEGVWVKL